MEYNTRLRNLWIRNSFAAMLVGGLLGFSGAFGTNELVLSVRVFYWISAVLVCTIVANFIGMALDLAIDSEAKPLSYHVVFLAILAMILPIVIVIINHLMFKIPLSIRSYKFLFLPVFIISLFMTILHFFMEKIPMQSHAMTQNEPNKEFRPKVFDRLDIKFRTSDILAIKSEDHYLRVFTSMGETLILLRLYDAINELEGIEGVQTHRSWWVAIEAIDRLEKDYGKNRFILKNALEVPISRGYAPTLKRMQLL